MAKKTANATTGPYCGTRHFFEFLGILRVALPHNDIVTKFLEPMTRFKDEVFMTPWRSSCVASTEQSLAIDTPSPKDPPQYVS